RVCKHCSQPDNNLSERFKKEMSEALKISIDNVRAFKGEGCVECNYQGCRGRVALYEFFIVTDEIADLIEPGVKTTELRRVARSQGWKSLREHGWKKVQEGIIPASEQHRLTHKILPQLLD
ncbi:MAG TPA: type II/IV secretion system protein, partial [Verrucomicrobiota bacterium]|nr:type II/IV secretion system protein [Verrucomicrobiota bacterium]